MIVRGLSEDDVVKLKVALTRLASLEHRIAAIEAILNGEDKSNPSAEVEKEINSSLGKLSR